MINEIRSKLGDDPGQLILDGKIHRFGGTRKSLWYIAFSNFTRLGQEFQVGQFGSWSTGETFNWQSNVEMTPDDRDFIKKKMAEASRRAQEDKENEQREVSERCSEFWNGLGEVEIPQYCVRKGIRALYGARSHNGDLDVP